MSDTDFRQRIWEALHGEEWLGGDEMPKERAIIDAAFRLHAEKDEATRLRREIRRIGDAIWLEPKKPIEEDPIGRSPTKIIGAIRMMVALAAGSKSKATKQLASTIAQLTEERDEALDEIETIKRSLREAQEALGISAEETYLDSYAGRHSAWRTIMSWFLGERSMRKRSQEAQQLWREMFAQLREVAVGYAPAVAHAQGCEHVFDLCRDEERFDLEIDRRIHRPSEAIATFRSIEWKGDDHSKTLSSSDRLQGRWKCVDCGAEQDRAQGA